MIDFPVPVTVGEEFVAAGVTFVWNGQGWTVKGAGAASPVDAYTKAESDGRFVNVPGDTMTGDLTIANAVDSSSNIFLMDAAKTTGATLQYNVAADTLDVFVGAAGIIMRYGGVGPYAYLLDQGHIVARMASPTGNCALYLDDSGYTTQVQLAWDQANAQCVLDSRVVVISAGTPSRVLCMVSDHNYNYWYNINNRITPLGQLLIANEGYKAVAGPWAAASDARIKTVKGDYTQGLAALKQINPVRFEFKGNVAGMATKSGDPPAEPMHQAVLGKEFIGLVAQTVETAMPEMVTRTTGVIDGAQVSDLRVLDITALTYALVNAVKELSAEVDALKAQLAPVRR